MSDQTDKKNNDSLIMRRKRINRIKFWIIVIAAILLIVPMISCIFLAVKVSKLQNEVNDLQSLHGRTNYQQDASGNDENYAYAAVKDSTSDLYEASGQTEDSAEGLPENNEQGTKLSGDANRPDFNGDQGKEEDLTTADNFFTVNGDYTSVNGNENEKNADIQELYANSDSVNRNDLEDKDNPRDKNSLKNSDMTDQSDGDGENNSSDNKTDDSDIGILSMKASGNDTNKSDNTDKSKNTNKSGNTDNKKSHSKTNDGIYAGKTVYITFDDGPSVYTDDILDILEDYHVKAAFFVIGQTDKHSLKMYQRIVDDGHTLGMHSYSHVYKQIYNSIEDFDKDFTKLWDLLYDTTGYKPKIYRFPGGSGNKVNKNGMGDFIRYLNKKSIVYYDWNVICGDSVGIDYTKQQLIDNVLKDVAWKKTSIVLLHDSITEKTTVDALPGLLEALISGGANLLQLDETVAPIQQIKFDSIK